MCVKFLGKEDDFLAILNKKFKLDTKNLEVKGNLKRYNVVFENNMHCINLFTNGTITIQPHNEKLETIIKDVLSEAINSVDVGKINDRKIVIVHGHDTDAKNALEVMIFRWGLKPFAIQDEDSRGRTIIEFLENSISGNSQSIGIVLLTPDDIGYSKKEGEETKRPRARQNVILELGMLIGALTRERTIIIKKTEVEAPSDIDGLIYIPFDEKIEEIKDRLRSRLESLGIEFH